MPSKVVVVVGASSGMGRAAALCMARRGDKVVVAARRGALLEKLARECREAGGEALAVRADVTEEGAMEELARQAAERFGRIDAWVHAASVAAFGRFEDVPLPVARRLLETNAWGAVLGARAAVEVFKAQGEGTLVLVASVLGKAPIPWLSHYNASKFAVVGLGQSLRAELKMDGLGERVRVCTLMPPATDTPFYKHAANYTGKTPRPPPPVYAVDTLADSIVALVDKPEDEVIVGAAGKLMATSFAAAPGVYDSLIGPYSRTMFEDAPAPRTDGAVLAPMAEGATADGGWKRTPR